MNPRSGSAGSPVSPASPKEAQAADSADPGEVAEAKAEQIEKKEGKYGSTPVTPYTADPDKEGWIEVELIDEEDQPVPGEKYKIELPDGSVAEGTLDEKGLARIDGIDSGTCKITFPELDKEAWEPV